MDGVMDRRELRGIQMDKSFKRLDCVGVKWDLVKAFQGTATKTLGLEGFQENRSQI